MAMALTLRAASRSISALFLPGQRNEISVASRLEQIDFVRAEVACTLPAAAP